MSENMHKIIDANEINFNDLAMKTRNYFLQHNVNVLINRFICTLKELTEHLSRYYKIIIVLEKDEMFEDLIEGLNKLYQRTSNFMEEE